MEPIKDVHSQIVDSYRERWESVNGRRWPGPEPTRADNLAELVWQASSAPNTNSSGIVAELVDWWFTNKAMASSWEHFRKNAASFFRSEKAPNQVVIELPSSTDMEDRDIVDMVVMVQAIRRIANTDDDPDRRRRIVVAAMQFMRMSK